MRARRAIVFSSWYTRGRRSLADEGPTWLLDIAFPAGAIIAKGRP
jgi:hypothetical protein